MNWNPVLIRPRHTLASVVQTLLDGFKDGTIICEPTLKLFPEFDAALEKAFKREQIKTESVTEFLQGLIERLALRQTPYVQLVTTIEGFWELLQEVRRSGTVSKEDLTWYAQNLVRGLETFHATTPQTVEEFTKLTKMLEVGLDQRETAVLEEVNIKLQLFVAELLKTVLQGISGVLHSELERAWKSESGQRFPFTLIRALENAFGSATHSRYADIDARIELLRLCLAREQASAITQSLISASDLDRREPRRQA